MRKKNGKAVQSLNAQLTVGEIYDHATGNGKFRVLRAWPYGDALLQSVYSGYHFIAAGITLYTDGTIEWRSSTNGSFDPIEKEEAECAF